MYAHIYIYIYIYIYNQRFRQAEGHPGAGEERRPDWRGRSLHVGDVYIYIYIHYMYDISSSCMTINMYICSLHIRYRSSTFSTLHRSVFNVRFRNSKPCLALFAVSSSIPISCQDPS